MKSKYWKVQCYKCGIDIFGMKSRYGGTFYKTTIDGDYHKKDCPGFDDAVQSGSNTIRKSSRKNSYDGPTIFDVDKNNENTENKISRICWNTNGWVKPSGRNGKTDADSFEFINGFGHEEWLFDMDKIINGYHYAFLQPVSFSRNNLLDKKINLLLYTINNDDKAKYWVGYLNNVGVVSTEDSQIIWDKYLKNGWLDDMKKDLRNLNISEDIINDKLKPDFIFNIKFHPKEILNIYEYPIRIKDEKNILTYRYRLFDNKDNISELKTDLKLFDFNSGSFSSKGLAKKCIIEREAKSYEMKLKHNLLSESFLNFLQNKYGEKNAVRECPVNGNYQIDIVQKKGNDYIFYEIKTYNHLKTNLRYALGQLFEYAYYSEEKRASKLYLVSDIDPDEEFRKYIIHLNTIFNIPLGYIQFDLEKDEIINKIN